MNPARPRLAGLDIFRGLAAAGMTGSVQDRAFARPNALILHPYAASFAYAPIALALVLAALVPLHRRGLHLRL